MRLKDFGQIAYGKEDVNASRETRTDIIYRVFLGDRQIWERIETDDSFLIAGDKVIFTWDIQNDFLLDRVTETTVITGQVEWGDNDADNWRSGNSNYFHSYATDGIYNITLNCENYLKTATISQVKEINHYKNSEETHNTLIGVILGKIPFSEPNSGKLNGSKGVFQGVSTIREVIIPVGSAPVAKYLFKDCRYLENVYIYDSDIEIKEDAFPNISSLTFHCKANSAVYSFLESNYGNATIITDIGA